MRRRTVVTGLAGLGAATALPALAQAIRSQSDPWAQVNPYDDPRNGFANPPGKDGSPGTRSGIFGGSASGDAHQPDDSDFEIRMGAEAFHAAIRDPKETGGLFPDQGLQRALWEFTKPLAAASDRPELPWTIALVRGRTFNATAYPGGKLVMFPDVIACADHPGELAAIIAHEIGHAVHSHGFNRVMATEHLARQVAENPKLAKMDETTSMLGIGIVDLLRNGHSRESEFEADAYIITLFERLGFHPSHGVAMYQKMTKYYRKAPDTSNSLFTTHPGTQLRIERMIEHVTMLPPPGNEPTLPGWKALKSAFPTPAEFRSA